MKSFQEKYQAKLEQYEKVFNLEDLNDANDKSLLEMMLRTEVMAEDLQEKIAEAMEEEKINANEVKKLHDLLKDATNTITNIQRTLNIDRKTRKSEETTSVADYLRILRRAAKEFMAQRIIPVFCPTCKVMVGRIYPVHDHTAFSCSFQCSQCKKMIRARREEKDVLFDVKDHQWRRAHRAVIELPKPPRKRVDYEDENEDDELYLGTTSELVLSEPDVLVPAVVEDDLELGTD